MFNYHLAPLAETISEKTETSELFRNPWLFAIYKALLVSVQKDDAAIYWKDEYDQWSIDHQYRGSKHSAKTRGITCESVTIIPDGADACTLEISFRDAAGQSRNETCHLLRDDFHPSLWEAQKPDGGTLLEGSFERDRIFDALCQDRAVGAEIADIQDALPEQPLTSPATETEAAETDDEIHPKFTALHKLLEASRKVYSEASQKERSFLETVIGAAVFYMPTTVRHFEGYISVEAILSVLRDGRRVKDHIYPRKLAGRTLLQDVHMLSELINIYHKKLARFMYVSPTENSRLVNFYDEYADHDSALRALGIRKFPFEGQQPFRDHGEMVKFLKFLKANAGRDPNEEELTAFLLRFRG
jgi:hypothetical protein